MEVSMKRILLTVGLSLCCALTCVNAWAQATAQMSGTVHDQSGAVLPGVEVTATQTDTGISRMTVTNETGTFILPNLALGPYRLEASLPGFRTFAQAGIILQVNSNPVINPVLEVGQVSETVEVQANAALVETRTVGIGQVVENQRIVELPLNGRNAAELMLLSGGNTQAASPSTAGRQFPGRLVISSAGAPAHGTDYNLDGIRHVDMYDGQAMPLPFPDALEEFKAETSGLSAQHGRAAAVSAVTKSGTNEVHGDLFEFVRNDLFNARNYFAVKGSTLKRNQFGGTVGGPIVKNKLFFFTGFQGTTTRQDPSDTRSYIPTAAMLAGDFTAFTAPACNAGRQITLRAPFVNNRIDPSQFSKVALNIESHLPHTDSPCGEIVYGRRADENAAQIVGKGDYQLSDRHTLFARYVWDRNSRPSAFSATPDNILNANSSGSVAHAHSGTFGSTYLVSSNMVNAFRLGVNRINSVRFNPPFFDAIDVGVKNAFTYVPDKMNVSVTNGFSLSGANDASFRTTTYLLSDDISWTHSVHQFAFGGMTGNSRTNSIANQQVAGNYGFNGQETGIGLADFLTGRMSDFSQGQANRFYARRYYLSTYAQDVWKVSPRITFNYGLRWSPVLPIKDYRDPVPSIVHFDESSFLQGVRSTVFANAPAGLLFYSDPGWGTTNNNVFNPKWGIFGPHAGLAWDVEGNGRTSVRASYSLNYLDFPTQLRQGEAVNQPPWGNLTALTSPAGGLDDPWRDYPGGNPFPTTLTRNVPFVLFGQYLSQPFDVQPTYTQSWNLSVQREVVPGTLVSLSYLGSATTHMWAIQPLNNAVFVPGNGDANGNCFLNGSTVNYKVTAGAACSTTANTQTRRRLDLISQTTGQSYGRMGTWTTGGRQMYNGMLLSVQRQSAKGITVNGNYTWAHCIGDYAGRTIFGYSLQTDETYLDPNDRRRDRADCESVDVRQSLNLTALYETPKFGNSLLSTVVSGWRVSGIYRRSTSVGTLGSVTGAFTTARTVTTGLDRALSGASNQRPNQVLANVYLDKSAGPRAQYLNPAAFAQPDLGTLGNFGRVNIDPTGTWQFDMALARVFKVTETQKVELRAEAYNVTNSFRPGSPNTVLNSPTFGQILTSLDPRILQFAMKWVF